MLFVGESPPAGGTFVYAANSNLYRATKDAFQQGVLDLLTGDFLDDFAALGCFSTTSASRRSTSYAARPNLSSNERTSASEEHGRCHRIREADPQAVAIIMKDIAENVRAALDAAGSAGVSTRAFPFLGRPRNTANYIRGLAEYLRWLRDEDILRTGQR